MVVLYDPFGVTCTDGAQLRANSGQMFRSRGEINLVGDVYFEDADRSLTADEATYNRVTGRLYATGNVIFENRTDGSTLRGPELEYFRAMEGRELAEVNATQRPTLTLPPPADSENPEPLQLVADRVFIIGEDDLSAFGNVIITRTDLDARSEEARYNSATENLELRMNAVVLNEGNRLTGEVIQAELTEGELDYVISRTDATLNSEEYLLSGAEIEATLVAGAIEHVVTRTGARMRGEDLEVLAEGLELFFADSLLQRVVATNRGGESKASAISRSFRLDADSLDASFTDQQLDVVYAIGSARGETIDTTSAAPIAEPAPGVHDHAAMVAAADSAAAAGPAALQAAADSAAAAFPAAMRAAADSAAAELQAPPAPPAGDAPVVIVPSPEPGGSPVPAPAASGSGRGILASDWIRGDTIIGYFEPVPADSMAAAVAAPELPADSASAATEEAPEVEIRRLVAIGSAQSLYRMTPTEPERASAGKDINFLVGDRIELELGGGELRVANVTGLKQGVFLEAAVPTTTPAPAQDPDASPSPDAPAID